MSINANLLHRKCSYLSASCEDEQQTQSGNNVSCSDASARHVCGCITGSKWLVTTSTAVLLSGREALKLQRSVEVMSVRTSFIRFLLCLI